MIAFLGFLHNTCLNARHGTHKVTTALERVD
jgi:hypothetical protein